MPVRVCAVCICTVFIHSCKRGIWSRPYSSEAHLVALLVLALVDERLVDVRDDTAARDGGLDERVELLVAADGELQVARRDALHLEVLGRVARELEDLGGQVLHDRGGVHGGRGT